MTDNTFDIHTLANEIFEVVCSPVFSDNPAMLLTRIKATLQRNIDTELVPKNFNGYVGKRKRDKWLRQLQRNDQEIKFWKRIVQEQNPNVSMLVLYEQLNSILSLSNLQNTAVPNSAIYCFYCEREMDAGSFGGINGRYATEDHIEPKSKFGKSGQDNLVNECNE